MFDPNEEVNKEYIGMLCKVMAQLGLAATQTDFVAQVKGEGHKTESGKTLWEECRVQHYALDAGTRALSCEITALRTAK